MLVCAERIAALERRRTGLEFASRRVEDFLVHCIVETSPPVFDAWAEIAHERPRACSIVVGPEFAMAQNARGFLSGRIGRAELAVRGEEVERRLGVHETIITGSVHRRRFRAVVRARQYGLHGAVCAAFDRHVANGAVRRSRAYVAPVAFHARRRGVAVGAAVPAAVFPAALVVVVHDKVQPLVLFSPRAKHDGECGTACTVEERHFGLDADLACDARIYI